MQAREARLANWRNRYPVLGDLEDRARRRLPYFVFDYLQGATGEELSRLRNADALKAIEIVPRYGIDISAASSKTTLFGREFSAPLAISPIGMDGAIWPGATRLLAEAAREGGIAYMQSSMATTPLEQAAAIAPDNFWFQLYGFPADDHAVTFDLVRRAREAGAHVLAVTLDIPGPARRVRDMRNGLGVPLRITPAMAIGTAIRPHWLAALARTGMPRFENLAPYCREGANKAEIDAFVAAGRPGAGITWETVARIREAWPGALAVKGIMHPGDAEQAMALGADGVIVSNHGGRQFDPAPATIDVLPAIRAAAGKKATVMIDGGFMSGTDVLKALACGADGVMAGRAFMLGLAALGADGAHHVVATLKEELQIALGQTGALTTEGARSLCVRHRNAWKPEDFRAARATVKR
jgi:(S)-mandelate dehydrogenase